jgi:type I restriction enzyme S subunit
VRIATLGDVCTVINGGTPDTKISKYWDGTHAWITPAEMGNLKSPYVSISRRTLTDEGLRNSSAQLLPKGSVILSSRAPIGHLVINNEPMATNQGCKGLIPNSELNYKYLYYFLYANKGYLNALGSGTTFTEISGTKLKKVSIPLPSVEKQLEIVEKLDCTFDGIAQLEVNLTLGIENVERLLQETLSDPFKIDERSVGRYMRLDEIADFQGGSQPPKSNFLYKEQEGYIRFIQIRDFGSDKNLTYIPISSKNRLCTKSDILIGRYGASVGKILTGLDGAYNVALMKVTPRSSFVDRDYLYFYLLSEIFQTNLLKVSDRSAQNGFSKDDIGSFSVKLPSLQEQKDTAKKFSRVRSEVLALNLVQLETKSQLTMLRESVLNSAFSLENEVA